MISRLLPIAAGLCGFVFVGTSLHRSSAPEVSVEPLGTPQSGRVAARLSELPASGREAEGESAASDRPAVQFEIPERVIESPALDVDEYDGEEPAEPGPEFYTARNYYGLRLENLRRVPVGDVREALTEVFCQRHPEPCAILSGSPDDMLLSEALPFPTDESLAPLESERAVDLFADMEGVTGLFDEVERYWMDVWGEHGPGNVQDIDSWLGSGYRERAGALVSDIDQWMQVVRQHGSAVHDDPDARIETEAALLEILWRERCGLENEMIELAPDLSFWIHLSRAATPLVWDGSYWLPPDEEIQFLFPFPVHID